MDAREELDSLRRLDELERKAAGGAPASAAPPAKASRGDIIAGLPITRLAMGAASPLIGSAQLGAHIGDVANRAMGVEPVVGPWLDAKIKEYDEAKQRGMAASGSEGYDWYGLLGSMLPGAKIAKWVQAAMPAAESVAGRAGVGAAQGGAVAAATPVTNTDDGFWSPKGLQTAAGTALGGAIPLVGEAAKGLGNVLSQASQPFTESGRAAILKELQQTLIGNDPAVKARIIQSLQQPQTLVPGSQPTAGEVLSDIPEATGLLAHQQAVSKLPGVSPQFTERAAQQEAARASAIGEVAQPSFGRDLASAVKARGLEAGQKYGAAVQQTVQQPDATFAALMERPSMQKAAARASQLAQEAAQTFNPSSVQSLHYMKMALDDLLKNPERFSIGATEAGAMEKTRGTFVKWLGEHAPAYDEARTAFQQASRPINRMQVGQELEKALTSPLGTSERSGVFAKAVEEAPRTIKKATGQAMFDQLEQVLQPQESQAVRNVAAELARKDAFQRLARGTKVGGSDAIPGNVGLPLPNLLSRPAMIANFALRHAGQQAEGKIAQMAASQYLHPQALAASLQDVPLRYRPMIEALLRQAPQAAGAGAARLIGATP